LSCGYKISEGQFINSAGEKLGMHKGVPYYTIGQRKNLGITFGKPMFVVKLDGKANTVVLGEHDELMKAEVVSTNNCFPSAIKTLDTNSSNMKTNESASCVIPKSYINKPIQAKVRYAAMPANAVLKQIDNETICTVFETPQRAIAPGQSIVFYDGDKVIGGGIID
jgi:tRNA-specific 2-thiouridylase